MLPTVQMYAPPIVFKYSPCGPKAFSKLSQSFLEVVSKFPHSCLKVVPRLPQSDLKFVLRLSQIVPKLSASCYKWYSSVVSIVLKYCHVVA